MQMPNDDFSVENLVCDESFQRYCLGSKLEDQILWKERIDQYPEHQQIFKEAEHLVNLLSLNQGSRLQQLKDLRTGIKQRESLQRTLSFEKSDEISVVIKPGKLSAIYKYAAIAAAVLLIPASFYFFNRSSLIHEPKANLVAQEILQVISSGPAPRKTVVLADGTVITLGKGSSIELHKQFNTSQRELWLKGEAFFDVKHDAARPFTVHTAFDDVRVLGTSFNVKAYPDDQAMETTLIKGSVRVNSRQYAGYFVMLKPNQKLISSKTVDPVADHDPKTHFKISSVLPNRPNQAIPEVRWVKKRLDIDDQPLSVIVDKLQNWYGIQIVIADDSVKKYRYSGIFENETIVKTLEALQLSYPFTFKMEQDKILISK